MILTLFNKYYNLFLTSGRIGFIFVEKIMKRGDDNYEYSKEYYYSLKDMD